jgi:hypothetical protein
MYKKASAFRSCSLFICDLVGMGIKSSTRNNQVFVIRFFFFYLHRLKTRPAISPANPFDLQGQLLDVI